MEVVAADPVTTLTLVRAPSSSAFPDGLSGALKSYAGMSYVALVDATPGGPSVRPAFIGRTDATAVEGWPQPLLRVPASAHLQSGDSVFTVTGRLVGLAMGEGDGSRLVTADMLESTAAALSAKGDGR